MPHKVYSKEAVERAKDKVAYHNQIIAKAREIKAGGRDAIKLALEVLRDMELTERLAVFSFLKKGLPQADALARLRLGMVQAYQDVITLFEKPEDFIGLQEEEKLPSQQFIKEAEVYEQRSVEENR